MSQRIRPILPFDAPTPAGGQWTTARVDWCASMTVRRIVRWFRRR